MQTVIMQAAIQVATAAVMALKETDTVPTTGANMAHAGEVNRHRHGRLALGQPAFNWKAPDKY